MNTQTIPRNKNMLKSIFGDKQKIEWNPVHNDTHIVVPPPVPAKDILPNWYTHLSSKKNPDKKSVFFEDEKLILNESIRRCMPFKDALTFGYIMCTWQDIWVESNDAEVSFGFQYDPVICKVREGGNSAFPAPVGYYNTELSWEPKWYAKTPKNYSCLITQPLNRYDLPFITLSGVIDSDAYNIANSATNLPFFIRKGFSGLIPTGTPMYQIIPFKRDRWYNAPNEWNHDYKQMMIYKIKRHFLNGYRNEYWSKKEYL